MLDFNEILTAWITSANPSETSKKLAEDRLKICVGDETNKRCNQYTEMIKNKRWSAVCKGCGCPIDKKVFSNKINPCPLGKWEEVDKKHNTYIKVKEEKTLL